MDVAVRKRKQSKIVCKIVFIHGFAFAIASLTEVPFIRNNWTSVFLMFGLVLFLWLMHEDDTLDGQSLA
jgi:hypothetical protein